GLRGGRALGPLIWLVVLGAVALPVLAIVALVLAINAREHTRRLEMRIARLEARLSAGLPIQPAAASQPAQPTPRPEPAPPAASEPVLFPSLGRAPAAADATPPESAEPPAPPPPTPPPPSVPELPTASPGFEERFGT